MNIIHIERINNTTIVRIELVVNEITPFGKIQITPRWYNAGKQLAKLENIVGQELIQIDAGQSYILRYKIQEFTFYFEGEK